MKRILCPKCENYLSFDETKYSEGQSLVFVCEHCGKQFSIRLGKSKMKAPRKEEKLDEDVYKEEFGCIVVIENVFGFKQVLPLQEGDNIIGRRCVGTDINTPIETGDMSMDRRHCIINVKRNRQRELVYTLRDAPRSRSSRKFRSGLGPLLLSFVLQKKKKFDLLLEGISSSMRCTPNIWDIRILRS